jgi:hypothetical protein
MVQQATSARNEVGQALLLVRFSLHDCLHEKIGQAGMPVLHCVKLFAKRE